MAELMEVLYSEAPFFCGTQHNAEEYQRLSSFLFPINDEKPGSQQGQFDFY